MVTNPENYIDDMAAAGANIFTFHVEVTSVGSDLSEFIRRVKSKNLKVALAVKPGTPVESVYPYIELIDMVLIMTVEPGFGGQKFMPDMMTKVRTLRSNYPNLPIQVDGGLGPDTIDVAAAAGANVIVAGSSVFKSSPAHAISILRRSVEKYGNGRAEADLSPLQPVE